MHKRVLFFCCFLLPTACLFTTAQAQKEGSLQSLLQQAATNYPGLKARQYELDAAAQQAEANKKLFLPTLDAMYQVNYATHNNITGMSYPQMLLPISGPPSAENMFNGVFGSAASVLFNWQAASFGRKSALDGEAQASMKVAEAGQQKQMLEHQVKVAHACLAALATDELVRLFAQNVSRIESDMKSIRSLVSSGVKPGVDTALMQAEISKAKLALYQAIQTQEICHSNLAFLVAVSTLPNLTDTLFYTRLPAFFHSSDSTLHPLLQWYDGAIASTEAHRHALAKTAAPSLGLWGTGFARGSGVDYQGNVKPTEGFGLQRVNYGVGVQLSIPLLQKARIQPQLVQQDLLAKAEEEKRIEAKLELDTRAQQAENTLMQALNIAKENGQLVKASQYAYASMRSRYQSGLANLTDLLQTQYSLLKAETDIRLAYIGAWKAALDLAANQGTLQPFLSQIN